MAEGEGNLEYDKGDFFLMYEISEDGEVLSLAVPIRKWKIYENNKVQERNMREMYDRPAQIFTLADAGYSIQSKGSVSQLMDDLDLINSVEKVEAMVNSIQKGVENVLRK